MRRNNIIGIALGLTNVILWVICTVSVAFMLMLIYWHFDPQAFKHVDVTNNFKTGFGTNNFSFDPGGRKSDLTLSELNHFMVYWIFIRMSIFFIFSILIINKIKLVLLSIKSIDTFYHGNIEHFKTMAKYGCVIFILSCFNFSYINSHFDFRLSISFGSLAFSIACLVLAEVFKEGKNLLEDKNMII